MNEQELKSEAYHEAGHVVMARLSGVKIRSVWIDRAVLTSDGNILGGYVNCYKRKLTFETAICMALAGAWAEKIYSGGFRFLGIGADLELANDLYVKHGHRFDMSLSQAWETTGLILSNPDNWRLVDAIAKRLLEKKSLSGRSIEKIIQEANPDWDTQIKQGPDKNRTMDSVKARKCSGPNGIRTRVTDVRGRCPNH